MTRIIALLGLSVTWNLGIAQDLVITNARIIVGTGAVIEQGSIVVSDGRIVSVSEDSPEVQSLQIDARGMTVMPGLIDTHRHDLYARRRVSSDAEAAVALEEQTPRNLQTLLAEGFTTIMVPGFPLSPSLEIRRRLKDGELAGPRLLITGPGFITPGDHPAEGPVCRGNPYCAARTATQVSDPSTARLEVRKTAMAGVDGIKTGIDRVVVPDVVMDESLLAVIVDEAIRLGLPAMIHAETVEDMIRSVELGARHLVHTPYTDLIEGGPGARVLRDAGAFVTTTVSFSSPQVAEARGGEYLRGDDHDRLLKNIRHLWDEGVVVAFGTDSPGGIRPIVEIEELGKVLTPSEIVTALTLNAAVFLGLNDELGTLEAGKVADIVIMDGDPLADISYLANVMVVIQAGQVVVDNR